MLSEIIQYRKLISYVLVLLILITALTKRCTPNTSEEPKITIVRDTIWQTKTDTLTIQTTAYQKVYVAKNDLTKIIKDTIIIRDTTNYVPAKIYRDTIRNNDFDLYTYNLVQGILLDSQLEYKLKVPREITVTKTIEHPKTFRSGLYLFSEIGGNTQQFNNFSIGLQYNRKGNWFISYRINVNELIPISHNIGIGLRIFN
jgi:hypothetical protein